MRLNPANVPPGLVPLIPMAERWHIEDDYDLEHAVSKASPNELHTLTHCLHSVGEKELVELDRWLAGPESYAQPPNTEYCAFTCLITAFESAKLELLRRGKVGSDAPLPDR